MVNGLECRIVFESLFLSNGLLRLIVSTLMAMVFDVQPKSTGFDSRCPDCDCTLEQDALTGSLLNSLWVDFGHNYLKDGILLDFFCVGLGAKRTHKATEGVLSLVTMNQTNGLLSAAETA